MTKYLVTDEELAAVVPQCRSMAQVLRAFDRKLAGGNHSHFRLRIDRAGIDTSHFTGQGWSRNSVSLRRLPADEILVVLPEGSNRPRTNQLKRALLEMGVLYQCVECGNTGEWNGKPITLEVDHVDGDFLNNLQENLRFLCPNCHSQQPNLHVKPKEPKVPRIKVVREKRPRFRKFDPSKEELERLVWAIPTEKVGEKFGVSGSAIGRRCKLLGISKPPRGYWAKQVAPQNKV